ncbi:MAG: hypothetical protein GY909_08870 [Oligoflexia bacterium]|nr:hypothetical protein [Oligoflexia bacterium]
MKSLILVLATFLSLSSFAQLQTTPEANIIFEQETKGLNGGVQYLMSNVFEKNNIYSLGNCSIEVLDYDITSNENKLTLLINDDAGEKNFKVEVKAQVNNLFYYTNAYGFHKPAGFFDNVTLVQQTITKKRKYRFENTFTFDYTGPLYASDILGHTTHIGYSTYELSFKIFKYKKDEIKDIKTLVECRGDEIIKL